MKRPVHHDPDRRLAFRVGDASIDKVIQEGGFAIVRPDVDTDPMAHPVGALLVIERTRDGLIECSIRRIRHKTKTAVDLVCDSTRRRYQRDRVRVPTAGETVKVVGLVVGKIGAPQTSETATRAVFDLPENYPPDIIAN